MNNAQVKAVARVAERLGITTTDAFALNTAARNLCRWYEQECGDGNQYASWAIERDEETGKPFRVTHYHDGHLRGKPVRTPIRDMEASYTRRITEICQRLGLSFYLQTDPRGMPLYVSREQLNDQNYNTRGASLGY
jgi:hypothetical protein